MKPNAAEFVNQYVKAVYDFSSAQPEELSLIKGEILKVLSSVDDNWLRGTSQIQQREGNFPVTFVEKIVIPGVQIGQRVFGATENFPSLQDGDLEFRKGDVVIGTRKVDENWWEGSSHGKCGIFPVTHVIELEVPQSLRERSKSVHASEPLFAIAQCDAVAQLDEELSFRTGDLITVLEVKDTDWYYGELGSKKGMFLAACVDLIQDTTKITENGTNNNTPVNNCEISDSGYTSSAISSDLNDHGSSIDSTVKVSTHSDVTQSSDYCSQVSSDAADTVNGSGAINSSISSQNSYSKITPYGKTLYPFVGQSCDELTFRENEIVYLIQHVDDQWIEGELDGKIGLFPTAFVSVIVDCPYAYGKMSDVSGDVYTSLPASDVSGDVYTSQPAESLTKDAESIETSEKSEDQIEFVQSIDTLVKPEDEKTEKYGLVKFTFVPETKEDIGLNEGDTITVIEVIDDNWIRVKNDHGNEGICPKAFVEIIGESPEDEPQHSSPSISQTDQSAPISKSQQHDEKPQQHDEKPQQHEEKPQLPSKPKPSLGPKPVLKPKPALLPKPSIKLTKPLKAVHTSFPLSSDQSSLPKSPSSQSLPDSKQKQENKFPKSPSVGDFPKLTDENQTNSNNLRDKSLPSVELDTNLDSLITSEMNKAREEADTRSRSSSTHSTKSSGSSGSFHRGTEPENSVSMRAKRPPPPNLSNYRHSVNFPVIFNTPDESKTDTKQTVINKTTPLQRSSTVETGYSTGLSTFFLDPLPDEQPRKSVPMRKPPPPPQRTFSVDLDLDVFDRKPSLRKPPPPRPLVPQSTTPVKEKRRKLVPQRAAPGPPKATKVPSRPAPPRPTQGINAQPRKPPLRAPQPVVITEEMREKMEANAEIISDLRKRIKEVENDLENYKKSKLELEGSIGGASDENKEESYDNIDFYNANIQGLSEELFKLRENLKDVCPEDVDAITRQMEEEARLEEEEKCREENRKLNEEKKEKRKEKREKVIEELINTETEFLQTLHLCIDIFLDPSAEKHPEVDMEMVCGNMEEIADVSQRLLTAMEGAINAKTFAEQSIGPCFISLAEDMKNVYAPYCRNHDDVISLIEKFQGNSSVSEFIEKMLDKVRERRTVFDLEALLITPVQRIVKYPLLLNELLKTTEDDHVDKSAVLNAMNSMTDVATAINEYKRRKDLVYKYKKDTDETFGDKLAKLSLHSLKKKGSRFKGRLSTTIGLSPQTKDETFDKESMQFMQIEKMVKIFIRDVQIYMEQIQDSVRCHESVIADIEDFYEEVPTCSMVQNFKQVHELIDKQFFPEFDKSVMDLVLNPLMKLTTFFEAPNKVIQKRYDKLLDYDSMLRKVKDEKVTEKAMQAVKNNYEALNAQLLDELPKLHSLSFRLLQDCIGAFISAQQRYSDNTLHRMSELLDLSSLLSTDNNVVEVFNYKHVSVVDRMSVLSFIPKGFNPRMEPQKQDKKAKRLSMDVSPAKGSSDLTPEDSNQSDSQRVYIQQKYAATQVYRVSESYTASDMMDLSLAQGSVVGVIVEKDPLGNQNRWFVDNGACKGFVPRNVLTLYQPSPPSLYPSLQDTDQSHGQALLQPKTAQQSVDIEEFDFALEEDMSPEITEEYNVTGGDHTEEFYYAEYSFDSRGENEVSLFEGQVVTVLTKNDQQGNSEWWYVDADGVKGYAPSVYLQPMS